MQKLDRKQATADYKKRETIAGVYAVRSAKGDVWVGHARDIDAVRNRIWFMLRIGGHMNKSMQAAWDEVGESGFELEPLELVDSETLGFTPDKVLGGFAARWRERLGARSA